MNILCFGGSFNPLHNGHLQCARAVARAKNFDRVMLIPSARPPHKPAAADLAEPHDRLEMCCLAVKGDALFEVSDIETSREGPSFTIQTARALQSQGWKQVNWLIGADMLNDLPNWREPLALLNEVNFVIVARPGYSFDWARLPRPFEALREHVVEAPLIDISATDIRRRVAAHQPITELVPAAVERYIRQRGLYGAND
jgi:nicotinate-nucleotide adenylyltransferase